MEEKDKLIAELKAENERLKEELKNNKSAYEVELGTYNMECGNLLEENKQLLQTLQEIKKIALLGTNTYKEEKEPDSLSTWKNAQFEKIINLITKAESEG